MEGSGARTLAVFFDLFAFLLLPVFVFARFWLISLAALFRQCRVPLSLSPCACELCPFALRYPAGGLIGTLPPQSRHAYTPVKPPRRAFLWPLCTGREGRERMGCDWQWGLRGLIDQRNGLAESVDSDTSYKNSQVAS